jgi:hypothetical protein
MMIFKWMKHHKKIQVHNLQIVGSIWIEEQQIIKLNLGTKANP